MELIEGSETSANHNRMPGKYPKEYTQDYEIVWRDAYSNALKNEEEWIGNIWVRTRTDDGILWVR